MFKVIFISIFAIGFVACLLGAIIIQLVSKKDNKSAAVYVLSGISVTSLLCVLFFSSFIVSEGSVLTQKCSGVRDVSYVKTAGFHTVNPFCSYTTVSVAESFNKFITNEDLSNAPLTADKLRMFTTVNMPVSVNPVVVPYLLNVYLTEENYKTSVIENSVWDSIRRGFAKFYWEIPSVESQVEGQSYYDITLSRDELVTEIRIELKKILEKKLIEAGIPQEVAVMAFNVGYPTISGTVPPASVSASIEEQKKAEAELKRQTTITAVAEKKAARGTQEGVRVKNLLSQVPGFNAETATVEETALIINSLAGLTNAESLEKGITEGKIEVWVVDGGMPSVSPKK
tara:strand:- start:86 stop:1111 length:1026 start_codon:yes stop_codon:yes gene_type:complete